MSPLSAHSELSSFLLVMLDPRPKISLQLHLMTTGIISALNWFSRSERSHTAYKLGFPSNGWFKSPSLISAKAGGPQTPIHPPHSETRSTLCGKYVFDM